MLCVHADYVQIAYTSMRVYTHTHPVCPTGLTHAQADLYAQFIPSRTPICQQTIKAAVRFSVRTLAGTSCEAAVILDQKRRAAFQASVSCPIRAVWLLALILDASGKKHAWPACEANFENTNNMWASGTGNKTEPRR